MAFEHCHVRDVLTSVLKPGRASALAGLALVLGHAFAAEVKPVGPKPASTPAAVGNVTGGFTAPVFENGELKTQFEGDSIRAQPDGRFLVSGFRLKTFRPGRQPELIAESGTCLFNQAEYLASSPGHLRLRRADDRFQVEGDGFEWRQSASQLVLSNAVRTVVRRSASIESPASTNELEVLADRLEYDSKAGIAVYHGKVRARDGDRLNLSCAKLLIRLGGGQGIGIPGAAPSPSDTRGSSGFERIEASGDVEVEVIEDGLSYRATGPQAEYLPQLKGASDLRFTGGARWWARGSEGQANSLTLRSRGRDILFSAEGKASAKLAPELLGAARPGQALPGPEPLRRAASPVSVSSDSYVLSSNRVAFMGHVSALNPEAWNLAAAAVILNTVPGTNRVQSILASGGVVIDLLGPSGPGQVRGRDASLDAVTGMLEVVGDARWTLKNLSGEGARVTIRGESTAPDIDVSGGSLVRLPPSMIPSLSLVSGEAAKAGPNAATGSGQAAASARLPVEIRSKSARLSQRQAHFEGGVTVTSGESRMECQSLVAFLREGNAGLDRLAAEGGVDWRQLQDRLQAARLTVSMIAGTNRMDRLTAEGGVRIEVRGKDTTVATGERADYAGVEGVMKLTGEPRVTMGRGVELKGGSEVVWDLATRRFKAKDYTVQGRADSLKDSLKSKVAPAAQKPVTAPAKEIP